MRTSTYTNNLCTIIVHVYIFIFLKISLVLTELLRFFILIKFSIIRKAIQNISLNLRKSFTIWMYVIDNLKVLIN